MSDFMIYCVLVDDVFRSYNSSMKVKVSSAKCTECLQSESFYPQRKTKTETNGIVFFFWINFPNIFLTNQ